MGRACPSRAMAQRRRNAARSLRGVECRGCRTAGAQARPERLRCRLRLWRHIAPAGRPLGLRSYRPYFIGGAAGLCRQRPSARQPQADAAGLAGEQLPGGQFRRRAVDRKLGAYGRQAALLCRGGADLEVGRPLRQLRLADLRTARSGRDQSSAGADLSRGAAAEHGFGKRISRDDGRGGIARHQL